MPHTPTSFRPLSLWPQVTRNVNREIIQAKKWERSAAKTPLQYNSRPSAAKPNHAKPKKFTHAAAAALKLDAAIPMRFADTEVQRATELRAMATETASICSSKAGS